MAAQHFRAGVVIVVRHPDLRRVMAFERSDTAGSWQLPQGGLIDDEEPVEAAWRELFEETGMDERHVVARAEYPEWVAYEWPRDYAGKGRTPGQSDDRRGRRRGQVQKWFLFDVVRGVAVGRPAMADRPRDRLAAGGVPQGAHDAVRCPPGRGTS
jgi:putative (di)nucleoside polyphosphate hydrolase